MPLLLPPHQVRGNGKLFAVDILAGLGNVEIFGEKFHRIHVQLGGQIIQCAHGENRSLWVVGRSPGTGRTDVVADGSVFFSLVRYGEHIRNGRHPSATGAAGAPGLRLPGDDGSVFLRAHFHSSVSGRPRPGDLKLGRALKHDAHGFAVSLLGDLRGENSPAIRRKLAAKTSAYVVLVNADVAGRNFQRFRHLPRNSGNILCGDVRKQMIGVGPLGDGTVALQAAMRNYRNAIEAFRNYFGLGESLVGIAQSLRRGLLIVRFRPARPFGMDGRCPNGVQHGVRGAIRFEAFERVFTGLCRDPVLLNLADHLLAGHLVVEHVIDIVHAQRALALCSTLWRLGIGDQVGKLLIFHFDGPDRVFRGGLVNRSYRGDFITLPVNR